MNFRRLQLMIALIVVFAAVPALAGTDCKRCTAEDFGDTSYMVCDYPPSGQWGNEGCRIECYGSGSNRVCFCNSSGWGCLYEVVQG